MNILITGGAGYLGSVLCEMLEGHHNIRVLDTFMYGRKHMEDLDVELDQGDARHIEDVVRAMQGIDLVIHLSGFVGDPVCAHDPTLTSGQNLHSTRMVANLAKYYKVKRFLFASSCSVYGFQKDLVTEASECGPVSLYAQDKLNTEHELLQMDSKDFSVGILRLATLFGVSRRPRFDLSLNIMTARAVMHKEFTVFGGNQWRPFCHVRDAARAFIAMMGTKLLGPVNVGANTMNIKIEDLGAMIKDITKAEVNVQEDTVDNRSYKVDFNHIKTAINFKPKNTLIDGIKEIKTALENKEITNYMSPQYSNSKFMQTLIME